MLKIYSRTKTAGEEQQELFFILEKIVNIALVKTEKGDNQAVKQILEDLGRNFKKFKELEKTNPDKFKALLWSEDFFNKYAVPLEKQKRLVTDELHKVESSEELRQEAAFSLYFYPESQLKGLTIFLNSFGKIWGCAQKNENDEISRYVVYHLVWLLDELTRESSNDLFVDQFLKQLRSITMKIIQSTKTGGEINASIYSASIHWYVDIVYNKLGSGGNKFNLSYLETFDKSFFSSAKYIISHNQTHLFESLISFLVDGVHVPSYLSGRLWDYGNLFLKYGIENRKLDEEHQLMNRIKELADLKNDVDSIEKRDEWLNRFEDVKKIITPHLDNDQQQNASIIEGEIREFVDGQFKYNNLLDIVFAIGAFCLFKQKPEYIRDLWEYKQPSDSDAIWAGHDIVPNTLDDIVQLYFKKSIFENKFGTWEGHHGSEKYYKEYFLLLLAHNLQTIRANEDGIYDILENYRLPDMTVYRLSDLEYSIDGLIELATELKSQRNTLGSLGFDLTVLDELFDNKLIHFLNILKSNAQERIGVLERSQSISSKKIHEFKDNVLEEYKKLTILRDIFEHYDLYQDETSVKYDGELDRFGIYRVDGKAAFFDEWHVHYVNFGMNYGRDMAYGENSSLLKRLVSYCEVTDDDFEKSLGKFEDLSNVLIFGTDIESYMFFEKSKNFKPKWDKDTQELDVNGFIGYYSFKNNDIPIFEIWGKSAKNQILLLNKKKMGKLVQYSPLNKEEDEKSMNGIFYMNIQDFSDDQDLMCEIIEKAPEWLKKIGDEEKQKEHLRERVLIHIFERFEYRMPEDFEGYLLEM